MNQSHGYENSIPADCLPRLEGIKIDQIVFPTRYELLARGRSSYTGHGVFLVFTGDIMAAGTNETRNWFERYLGSAPNTVIKRVKKTGVAIGKRGANA